MAIKRVPLDSLKPGMYIHRVDCGWLHNPYMRSSFLLDDERVIRALAERDVQHVYIDTGRGRDVEDAAPAPDFASCVSLTAPSAPVTVIPRVPMDEELPNAQRILSCATRVLDDVFRDLRLGKQIRDDRAKGVVAEMTESVFRNRFALSGLSSIKEKDDYTFTHSVNVCVLMLTFARARGAPREKIEEIGVGALLHDVGKVKVDDRILNKPGPLNHDEIVMMKAHVTHGLELLSRVTGLSPSAMALVAQHHERLDGRGYPLGLEGEALSEEGQMASIVDMYDAITSDRCYRKAKSPNTALKEIYELAGSHFEKRLVESFIRAVGIYPAGTLVRTASGFLGVVVENDGDNLLRPKVRFIYNLKKGSFIAPRLVDMGRQAGGSCDTILGSEDPGRWNVNPHDFTGMFGRPFTAKPFSAGSSGAAPR